MDTDTQGGDDGGKDWSDVAARQVTGLAGNRQKLGRGKEGSTN